MKLLCPAALVCALAGAAHATPARVAELVTAAGDADGELAIRFHDHWFSLGQRGGEWRVTNDATADDLFATPTDLPARTEPICTPTGGTSKKDYQDECDGVVGDEIEERRTYDVVVRDTRYRILAMQELRDERRFGIGAGPHHSVTVTADLSFTILVTDPRDGQDWHIRLRTKRSAAAALGQPDELTNDQMIESAWAAAGSEVGGANDLTDGDGDVVYLPEVELEAAYKEVPGSASRDLAARANPATQAAFADATAAANDHSYPEAISGVTSVAQAAQGAGSSIIQFKRLYEFFMKGKSGSAGFSQGQGVCGAGEDAISERKDNYLRFHAPLVQCTHRWPFLWGICGLEAHVGIGVGGSLSYGTEQCFDGVPTAVGMEGRLEFRAEAGAGFGCNLFVASASAGLQASVATGVHFTTRLDAGQLIAATEMYNRISFGAFFRVRFLFWKKTWEPAFVKLDRFGASFEKSIPRLAAAADQLDATCEAARDRGGFGTCDVAGAVCDVLGRCNRYTEVEPGQWRREDVGVCQGFVAPPTPGNEPGNWCIQLNGKIEACGGRYPEVTMTRAATDGYRYRFSAITGQLMTQRMGDGISPIENYRPVGQTELVTYRLIWVPQEVRNVIHELANALPTTQQFATGLGAFLVVGVGGGVAAGLVVTAGGVGAVVSAASAHVLNLGNAAIGTGRMSSLLYYAYLSARYGTEVARALIDDNPLQTELRAIEQSSAIVWQRIIDAAPTTHPRSGAIPKYFTFVTDYGNVFVTPNAIKHMMTDLTNKFLVLTERSDGAKREVDAIVRAIPEQIKNLIHQEVLHNMHAVVTEYMRRVAHDPSTLGKKLVIDNWEMVIEPGANGPLPAISHAAPESYDWGALLKFADEP